MTRGREAVVTTDAPEPSGSYSQAIAYNGLLYVSGQTGRRPDGTRATEEPFLVQARLALANLDAIARGAGTSLAHALQVTVYLVDPGNAAAFDAEYRKWVSSPMPARVIVQSALTISALEISAVIAL
jgi:2-iminobutanoate/2-iminopropanoate deaminase